MVEELSKDLRSDGVFATVRIKGFGRRKKSDYWDIRVTQ